MKTRIVAHLLFILLIATAGNASAFEEGASNNYFGTGAGGTGGFGNSFFGAYAGDVNTGNSNTFMGYQSGKTNTGHFNTFIGNGAGYTNTTGDQNTFLGFFAGRVNATGGDNTFLGFEAGRNNTAGSNTFIGSLAGHTNVTGIQNTFIGYRSGLNSTADFNTFIGYDSGLSNSTGEGNTFIGSNSGSSNTTGDGNTFMGSDSGSSTTSGQYNTFIGYRAGKSNTGGWWNTFIGNTAGYSNTIGASNTFLGFHSGSNNTEGTGNTFIGRDSGYTNADGNYNTFVGQSAGYSNSSGFNNVFIGFAAGSNETGSNMLYIDNSNTGTPLIYGEFDNDIVAVNGSLGVGTSSPSSTLTVAGIMESTTGGMKFPDGSVQVTASGQGLTDATSTFYGQNAGAGTTGLSNTFIGADSAYNNTTGYENTFVGYQSGYSNVIGRRNTYIGYDAGYSNDKGEGNVLIGYNAGYFGTGHNKLYIENSSSSTPLIYGEFDHDIVVVNGSLDVTGTFSTQGNINTPSGYQIEGVQVIKADNDNTLVGRNAGQSAGLGNVFIGYQAGLNETGNYKLYIDNSSTSTPLIYGEFDADLVEINGDLSVSGNTYVDSDRNLKKDIQPIQASLDKVLGIQGVSFSWKDHQQKNARHYGVIAQQVEQVLPEIVKEGQNGRKKVAYMELLPVLIEAVKEQHGIVLEQQKTISDLIKEVKELKKEITLRGSMAMADTY